MRVNSKPLLTSILFSVVIIGCGDDVVENGGGAADTGEPDESVADVADVGGVDTAPDPDATEEVAVVADPVSIAGVVLALISGDGLGGIEACVYEHPEIECSTSDSNGEYLLLDVPANSALALSYTAVGYVPFLSMIQTGEENVTDVVHFQLANAERDIAATFSDVSFDDEKGQIFFAVYREWPPTESGDRRDGTSVTMVPFSGIGPIYGTEAGVPDPDLEATTLSGNGGFMNVDVGEVEVTFSHGDLTCRADPTRWVGSTPGSIRMISVAGFLSYSTAYCE
jgi:hypothetical protein